MTSIADPTPDDLKAAADAALRLFPAPVAVVGAAADGVRAGLLAAWVTRVSMEPPLVLVAVGHTRHTYGVLAAAASFTVSLLGEGQIETARLFGLVSGRERDKWAEVPMVLMDDRTPALRDCAARLLCTSAGRFTAGDHDCFVGHIMAAEVVSGGPALPLRGADYAPRP
ncbi:MAG TPA: flavin reductase family protein [Candidatus Krumholzibacteria bacterium]|nr:flavin reductase family protein [Candidatus Krumholzibacteria bacterium]